MTLSFDSRIRPADSVLVRELEGEAVLLNLDNESYYGLDTVGARMWSVVIASESIQSAYEVLVNEFEVEEQELRHDLGALIEEWLEHGLATIDSGGLA